jgi:hypothetical protein
VSYTIEYNHAVFAQATERATGTFERMYVVASECGDNRTYQGFPSYKRARDWMVAMIGTREDVLIQAVSRASYCEVGGLKLDNKTTKPEAYIRRIRGLLDNAPTHPNGAWKPAITLGIDDPLLAIASALPGAMLSEPFLKYGPGTAVFRKVTVDLANGQAAREYFALAAKLMSEEKIPPWNLAETFGLPRS